MHNSTCFGDKTVPDNYSIFRLKSRIANSNLARFYIQHGKLDKGMQYYRETVRLAPFYVNVYDSVAFDLLKAGQPDKAVSVLDDLIRYNKNYVSAYIEKAEIRINQYKYDAAIETLQQAKAGGLQHPDMDYSWPSPITGSIKTKSPGN